MKTPNGIECPFFYGDYYRGKKEEECRLLSGQSVNLNWTPDLCKTCPVPSIKRANACTNMVLTPTIKKNIFGKNKQVKVTAYCTKSNKIVEVPEIGCGICHPISEIFEKK